VFQERSILKRIFNSLYNKRLFGPKINQHSRIPLLLNEIAHAVFVERGPKIISEVKPFAVQFEKILATIFCILEIPWCDHKIKKYVLRAASHIQVQLS
jgi:hypothetical protein